MLFLLLAIAFVLFQNCKTKQELAVKNEKAFIYKQATSKINLKAPINSANETELKKIIYDNNTYGLLQLDSDKFKDNAPFIELLDGGKRERLWFSSSRADTLMYGKKNTNHYQQIYFCEREIGDGKYPGEGWSEPQLFVVKTDNPYYRNFTEQFNNSTKGAVTLQNDLMIFSSDLFINGRNSEFKDLWEISRVNGEFKNPKPIVELSPENTWESQPTLSADGKHLFFVSNRKVMDDGTVIDSVAVNNLNIFYSFKSGDRWDAPVLVSEIASDGNEVTPCLRYDNSKLYFSSNRDGNYNIYEVEIKLSDGGGYFIQAQNEQFFSEEAIDITQSDAQRYDLNDQYNQQYPFYYFNPVNKKIPRAIYWSSDDPQGLGSYDLYACSLPYVIQYNVRLIDLYASEKIKRIELPVIQIEGFTNEIYETENVSLDLYSGLNYNVSGGSYACEEKGTYVCDIDEKYIFIGYSHINSKNPMNRFIHDEVIHGPEVKSQLSKKNGFNFNNVKSDTIVNDSIFITKAWLKKPFCPGKITIEPIHKSITYFQTGFWEVNTTENLKRDLELLHQGFEVRGGGDIYNPGEGFVRKKSDYNALSWEIPVYPVIPNDGYNYSIANARWVELHPNNYYWGDRVGFPNINERMKGRIKRINDYISYAQKVDENIKNLVDTIQNNYIDLLDLHNDRKPRLLIEIFAVSDEREIIRGWYIGDTVEYRGSEYKEKTNEFTTEQIKIVPPVVDERKKEITKILPCTIELNEEGNNGTKLGLSLERSDQNTNLSRLRAWYGYREIYKQLIKSNKFNTYLEKGRVALPENNLSYDDADIIIITRGIREDGDVKSPKYSYPVANNPSGNGYYDYDKIRRIEIRTSLLLDENEEIERDYCCDPSEE